MLFAAKLASDQRRDLLSVLATRLQQISRSDREYGAAEPALVSAMESSRIGSWEAVVLLPALRTYIVRHASARRCTDNLPAAGKIAKSAEAFNAIVARLDPTEARYRPIAIDEAKPVGDDGTHQRDVPSVQSQEVTEAMRELDHDENAPGTQVVRWTLEQRASEAWREHYDDTVKLVHDLKESGENSPEAFFCVKADALNLLATLSPPGPSRDKAMEEYREFLEEYYASIQNPNLWFTMFRHMLYTARFSDDPKEKTWMLHKLARSSNPIIGLYAQLETRIGPPAETYPASHVKAAP